MELVALLPWWVGVILALVSYMALHAYAAALPEQPVQPGLADMGTIVQHGLLHSFAGIGQYILPMMCLCGAACSAIAKRRRTALHARAVAGGYAAVASMSWRDFERLTSELFRRRGYTVIESRRGPDGGVDLRMQRNGQSLFVQCKHWQRRTVGVNIVRELYGVVAARQADAGIVVTSGSFSAEARQFARNVGVELVDGVALQRLVTETASPDVSAKQLPAQHHAQPEACPLCGGAMAVRIARRGSNIGKAFMGCRSYPGCKGTRPYIA